MSREVRNHPRREDRPQYRPVPLRSIFERLDKNTGQDNALYSEQNGLAHFTVIFDMPVQVHPSEK